MQTGGPGSPGRKKHDKNAMFASAGPHRLSRSRGIILSWDPVTRHGDSAVKVEGPTLKITRPPVEEIEALGFRRDEELEDHLRLFAGAVLLFTRCVAVAALRPPPHPARHWPQSLSQPNPLCLPVAKWPLKAMAGRALPSAAKETQPSLRAIAHLRARA